MAFLCVSQQGEFKNTIKNFLGKIHVKNFWPEKSRFFFFPLSSLPSAFVRFSTRGVQKHHKTPFIICQVYAAFNFIFLRRPSTAGLRKK
jgi:hypothetical protein